MDSIFLNLINVTLKTSNNKGFLFYGVEKPVRNR